MSPDVPAAPEPDARVQPGWRGRYFEDFRVGDVYRHPLGRTITETDNVWLTLLTQNTAPIHFDSHYAAQTEFGRRLVDSTFTLALVTGQSVTDVSQNVMANLGWDEVRLPAPVFEGDTLYSQSEVLSARPSKSRPAVGIVEVRTTGFNQDGVVVIVFRRTLMVYRRGHGRRSRDFRADVPRRGAAPLSRKLGAMIERAPFGATGHESSRAIFGAASLGAVSKRDADRALELLLEHGVNHIDVAASYGDAELRIATWLRRHEGEFFVATKTGERTYAAAREEIRRSLDRLGVDRVDSIQLHNLVDVIDWETALGADGALEAAIEAREEGLVRFIGVTGHGLSVPEMHRRSLERFPFDSVLLPYNFVQMQDPRYADRFEAVAAVCQERNVALQTIKSLASRRWDGRAKTASTWYEPLRDQADIDLAAHWVLGRPEAFLLTTGDVEILPMLLDAAERYESRPSDEQMREMTERQELAPLFV